MRSGIEIDEEGMNPLQCMQEAGDVLFTPVSFLGVVLCQLESSESTNAYTPCPQSMWTIMDVNTMESVGVSHQYSVPYGQL